MRRLEHHRRTHGGVHRGEGEGQAVRRELNQSALARQPPEYRPKLAEALGAPGNESARRGRRRHRHRSLADLHTVETEQPGQKGGVWVPGGGGGSESPGAVLLLQIAPGRPTRSVGIRPGRRNHPHLAARRCRQESGHIVAAGTELNEWCRHIPSVVAGGESTTKSWGRGRRSFLRPEPATALNYTRFSVRCTLPQHGPYVKGRFSVQIPDLCRLLRLRYGPTGRVIRRSGDDRARYRDVGEIPKDRGCAKPQATFRRTCCVPTHACGFAGVDLDYPLMRGWPGSLTRSSHSPPDTHPGWC